MKKRGIFIIFSLFVFIFILNNTEAGLTGDCQATTLCNGLALFSISSLDNAHAALSPDFYNYKICCPGSNIFNNCNSGLPTSIVIKLSSQTNAHVEKGTNNNYQYNVCLGSDNQVDCTYTTGRCDESNGYYCVAKISSETNAHVGSCADSPYPISVCCKAQSLSECGDGNLDQNENCLNCPTDAGCNSGQTCLNVDSQWACIPLREPATCGNGILELGETCSNCPQDAPLGFCEDTCNNNNICDQGESCLCNDCVGQQATCNQGNICNEQGVCVVNQNDGICTTDETAKADDPDCCIITSASWNTNIATRNSLVNLIVEGNQYCTNRQVSFTVYEDEILEDTYIPPDPQSKLFKSRAESSWSVVNVDDGYFQGEPEFYFIATSGISSKKSDLLDIMLCQENDGDCDNVKNDIDKCPDTPLSEIQNVDSDGCALGEEACVAEWDCTNALWSDCNEEGYRTRDINKCIYRGSNLLCESKFKPLERQACLIEEAFSVFTAYNVLLTLVFILVYYFLFIRIKK